MDFNRYMNTITASFGLLSTIIAIFMAEFIKRLGWTRTALITPVVMLITGLLFFGFLIFENDLVGLTQLIGTTPLFIAVLIGGIQNCLSKSAKYSIFDGTKEMAFIPLERSAQLKGKAAIDGVGSRLGKSGGSLVHQGIILIFGGLAGCIPYVALIITIVIILWIYAAKMLGQILDNILNGNNAHNLFIAVW
jgi:AAA family ATP:ADP antiporter